MPFLLDLQLTCIEDKEIDYLLKEVKANIKNWKKGPSSEDGKLCMFGDASGNYTLNIKEVED